MKATLLIISLALILGTVSGCAIEPVAPGVYYVHGYPYGYPYCHKVWVSGHWHHHYWVPGHWICY